MNNRFINSQNLFNIDDLQDDNIEIIEIDDTSVEIIEIDDLEICDKRQVSISDVNIKVSLIEKIRKHLNYKKVAFVTVSCVTVMVTLTSLFILGNDSNSSFTKQSSIVYNEVNDNISFSLIEPEYNIMNVNEEYIEKGARIVVDGVDYSDDISIDVSNLDTTMVGTYHVVYSYPINKNQVKTLYRSVKVVDNEAPTLRLLGSNIYTMLVGDDFVDEGVIVSDNSNLDLTGRVVVDSNINNSVPGTYYVKYSVSDFSSNESFIIRTVVVKSSFVNNSNTVLSNSFNSNGIYLSGCVKDYSFKYQMLLKNKSNGLEYKFDVNKTYNHYYDVNLDITSLSNGVYEFYLVNDSLELLTNNMNDYKRIVRSHIGDKLVTMNYDKNNVNMVIEDFSYLYDVVIDPGHGGSEMGAVNGRYIERNINLEQSLYEKKRFEDHGLRVLLLRDSNDDYGVVMGSDSWDKLDRKAYALGYYGSVSRVVYSNHHNSSGNNTSAGWEILVPSRASYEDLSIEHNIASIWSDMYISQTDPYYRFYTKDYEEVKSYNKMNGEIYSFEDYYAVIRVPNKLFNVKNVLYEGAYINNDSDMWWYYDNASWKTLSEVKIKAYVESLGITYIAP